MPSMEASVWVGTRLSRRLALSLIRRIDSLPNRCLITMPSSWPDCRAIAFLIFAMVAAPSLSQPPKVSSTRGWKTISSAAQASWYFWHFCLGFEKRLQGGSWSRSPSRSAAGCWGLPLSIGALLPLDSKTPRRLNRWLVTLDSILPEWVASALATFEMEETD